MSATAAVQDLPLSETKTVLPPRLWPAIVLVGIYWVAWATVTLLAAGTFTQFLTIFWTPMGVAAGLLVWWLLFSRLPWIARILGPTFVVVGGLAALALCHDSMKFGLLLYALPVALTASVACLVLTAGASSLSGLITLLGVSLLSWGYFTLIRFDGITGGFESERSWRWSLTPEDIFLSEQRRTPKENIAESEARPVTSLIATAADWPEFRGARRDSRLHGTALPSGWSANPPQELWRRRVGPGWSSFAVIGQRAYTQEQRGDQEAVVCFDIKTGNEIWSHEGKTRFEEVVAGAGPRGTPTFHQGRLCALGGSGVLNCLDAATGEQIWQRDIASEASTKPPQWGFSSSPLVAHGLVTVFAGGKNGKSVLAFDAATGEPKWSGGKGTHSYSSPQLERIDGFEQILMVSDHGLQSFEPKTGEVLWEHEWNLKDMFRVCQPTMVGLSQVLLGTGMGFGTRLLEISKEADEWKVTEKWTTKDLKPYFNDSVVLDGHVYGYDGAILTCLDLETGKRKWKKGRYGYGQILLVGEDGLMLVVSEQGEIALVEVSPTDLKELTKFQAVQGKTWNHPVIAHGKLLVRNGEEMACYELGTQTQPPTDSRPLTSDF